MTYFKMDQEAS